MGTPLYLKDRITLRRTVSLRAADVRKLREDFGVPDALKWTYTREERVWDSVSGSLSSTTREMAYYQEDDVFCSFVDLAKLGMPMMEKLSTTFGEPSGWKLRFAGVLLLDAHPANPDVLHIWEIPSYDSLWRMMDALREELWYILLQGFVDAEHQNLLRDASHPDAFVKYGPLSAPSMYMVASHRISPIEYLSLYGDVGDYLDLYFKQVGGAIALRGTITTGTLGSMQRVYAASAQTATQVAQASAELRLLFDALRLTQHNTAYLPPALQEKLQSVPPLLTQFWPFVIENEVELFQRLPYDHAEDPA